ncbi:hypothetical protein GCM10029992_09940 [Glycomyces albus]
MDRPSAGSRQASRLAVGVVSAGRVGSVVGAALARAGHRVVAASAVSEASRARAARHLPGAEILTPPDVAAAAELLVLAVPDDALAPLARALPFRRGQIVVHTSGANGAGVLAPAAESGALTAAIAPAMTFTGGNEDLDRLAGVSWAVTGEADARFIAEALVVEMGGEAEHLAEADRTRYHAALVYSANHLVTLVNDTVDQLRAMGVDAPERLLAPWPRPRSTTPCATATPGCPARSPAATPGPSPPTLPPSTAANSGRPTGPWPAAPSNARSLPAASARPRPENCSKHSPTPRRTPMTSIVHSRPELAAARAAMTGTVAVVPTMGALHDGHRANIKRAVRAADAVIVTVFVNPLQFRPGEDLDRYPRTLDADMAVCEEEGVDLVFAPSEHEMYPEGRDGLTTVHAGSGGDILEGASRPGFFTGVLTVVAKLFALTRPDFACFGEKDFQQLAVVRRMVGDLDMGVEILSVPTDREPDGLARSSRNVYLSETERAAALAIPTPSAPPRTRPTRSRSPRRSWTPSPDSRSTTSPSAPRNSARPPNGARPGSSSPPGRAPPASSTTPRSRLGPERSEIPMLRTMFKSKIHRATVTQADLHYVGSVTVDADLLEAADILDGEQVAIVDITNGARLETYTIAGERGSGVIGINGAAAHLVDPGDLVILISYAQMEDAEARSFTPRVVHVDENNEIIDIDDDKARPAPGTAGNAVASPLAER